MIWVLGLISFAPMFVYFKSKLHKKYEEEILKNKNDVIVNLTKQVSPDIRSPLSALSSIVGQLQNIPEHHRLILRSSVNRISDIANTLLTKAKEQKSQNPVSEFTSTSQAPLALSVELLPALVDSIVSEKRVQFRDKIGIDIEGDLSNSYGAFANINVTELSRLLSNTVNNSAESLPKGKGTAVISVQNQKDSVILSVSDNGKGIPKHILEKLGQMGVTHGKERTQSGSGLGVYHAKKTIESFGGKFEIQTEEGNGTRIIMTLPVAPTPKWFVDKISLKPHQQVVSLDDDLSIHGIWKGCFESKRLKEISLEHLTFTSGDAFNNWFSKLANESSSRLYLVDYELLNQKHTGLEIIANLGIGSMSILITSRYEEPSIRAKCDKLGVRLLPKSMAGFVPIEIEKPKELLHAVLIDDDVELMHGCWNMAAESKEKKFRAFAHPEEFFKVAATLDFSTPIYVDSNLGHGIKGEDVSKKIFEMGFMEIYLCTGYQASDFSQLPWIRAVVGKEVPWG
jgi:hypothetical protein